MTATHDLDRLIRAFLDEGLTELPTHAYDAVRSDIERTRQRVVIGPWSEPHMPRLASVAIAAAAVLIVGAVGLTAIGGPGSRGGIGPSTQVGQVWSTDDSVAFTIRRDPTDDADHYWRAATYDRIDLKGYSSSARTIVDRPAGTRILQGRADDAPDIGVRSITFTVIPGSFTGSTIVSPATPVEVDQPTSLSIIGRDGYFATLDRTTKGNGAYTVTALVPVVGIGEGRIDRAALLAAGTDYPAEVSSTYAALPGGMWGPNLEILKNKVLAAAPTREPIDIAQALEQELRSPAYTYATDIRDVDCGTMSTAECFATVKRGFCQWYALTMAVVLRETGIPARIADGFLPGSRDQSAATEIIRNNDAHAWVEVYFPRYGWVTFDPTGGGLPGQLPAALPSGPPNGTATP
jgi:transglutaminase-like putative cysteine protease